MNGRDLRLQRAIDGELGAAELAALQHVIDSDPAVRTTNHVLEQLHIALQNAAYASVSEPLALAAQISEALPAGAPRHQKHVRMVDVAFALAALAMIGLFYGLIGNLRDWLPLTGLAIGSIIGGALLIVMARPLRRIETGITKRVETSLFSRMADKRVSIGTGDVLIYRMAGLAIIVGGVWLARHLG